MAVPSSGVIKFSDLNTETGLSATTPTSIGSNRVRILAGVMSGQITLGTSLRGKSHVYKGFVTFNKNNYSTSEVLDFYTETVSLTGVGYTVNRQAPGASGGPSVKALFAGGATGVVVGTDTWYNIVDGMNMATYANFSTSATLDTIIDSPGSCRSTTNMYVAGGYPAAAPVNKIRAINWATETASLLTATLVSARASIATGADTNARGYFFGGDNPFNGALPRAWQWEIDGIDFATNTAINPAAAIPFQYTDGTFRGCYHNPTVQNQNYAYHVGTNGQTWGISTDVDRYYTDGKQLRRFAFATETYGIIGEVAYCTLTQAAVPMSSRTKGYVKGPTKSGPTGTPYNAAIGFATTAGQGFYIDFATETQIAYTAFLITMISFCTGISPKFSY